MAFNPVLRNHPQLWGVDHSCYALCKTYNLPPDKKEHGINFENAGAGAKDQRDSGKK
jgi:hypothetical protein